MKDNISGNIIQEQETASCINDFLMNIGPKLAQNCTGVSNFDGIATGVFRSMLSYNKYKVRALIFHNEIVFISCILYVNVYSHCG